MYTPKNYCQPLKCQMTFSEKWDSTKRNDFDIGCDKLAFTAMHIMLVFSKCFYLSSIFVTASGTASDMPYKARFH